MKRKKRKKIIIIMKMILIMRFKISMKQMQNLEMMNYQK